MKIKKLHILKLALGSSILIMVGCASPNKMIKNAPTIGYDVTPDPLVMKGDSVEVSITGRYPAKFFNKSAVVVVTPMIKWEDGNASYDKVTLQGEKVQGNATTIPYATGGSFTFTGKIPYSADMLQSELILSSTVSVKGKESVALQSKKIADGVVATAALLQNDALSIEAMNQFKRIEPISAESQINFLINRSDVSYSELRKDEIVEMKAFIADAEADSTIQFKSAKVFAYASPDGTEEINAALAEKRQIAAEKIIAKDVKVDVEGTFTPEDWDGFRQLMQSSSIENKEVILSVLSKYSDPVERETEIKKMSVVYEQIAKEILPELRRSKIVLNAEKVGRSDSLLLVMGLGSVSKDTLSTEEYLYAATIAESKEDGAKILTNATSVYPTCWRTFNNLGVIYCELDKLTEAQQAFNKADELSDGDKAVKNNLGVVAVKQGDLAKGFQYFELAQGAGQEVNHNMGVIKVKEGDYPTAVSMFGSNATFNAALAKLLNGDVDGALQTVEKAEADIALNYYLKAIIGARTQNLEMILTNLRTAIEKDSNLRDRAQKDLEFVDFFDDTDFNSVVK